MWVKFIFICDYFYVNGCKSILKNCVCMLKIMKKGFVGFLFDIN